MQSPNKQYDVVFTTKLATMGLRLSGDYLIGIDYLNKESNKAAVNKTAAQIKSKIEDYIEKGAKIKISDITVKLDVTPFQERVLKQLLLIPYGQTRTYGEIAKILGIAEGTVKSRIHRARGALREHLKQLLGPGPAEGA